MMYHLGILFFLVVHGTHLVVGNPVSSFTPRASTDKALYLIYFHDDVDSSKRTDYARDLEKALPENHTQAITLHDKILTIAAVLTESQVSKWKTDSIEAIESDDSEVDIDGNFDDSTIHARDRYHDTFTPNSNAFRDFPEMLFLSQPPRTELEECPDYAYDDTAGRGVDVYVQDTGINRKHIEFKNPTGRDNFPRKGSIETLYPKSSRFGNLFFRSSPDKDDDGHGTCVSDKIIGTKYGSAKSANLFLVPTETTFKALATLLGSLTKARMVFYFAGLAAIIEHVEKRQRENKNAFPPVVNWSYGLLVDEKKHKKTLDQWRNFVRRLDKLGATMIAASGNAGHIAGREEVDEYPALFAKEFKSVIPVGSVDIHGVKSTFSQEGPLVKVHAPGRVDEHRGMPCAGKKGERDWNIDPKNEGTSYSTGTISGIAAVKIGSDPGVRTGNTGEKVAAWLYRWAYIREGGDVPSVWNTEIPDIC